MDKIVANLDTLKNLALELNERSKYFANKKIHLPTTILEIVLL